MDDEEWKLKSFDSNYNFPFFKLQLFECWHSKPSKLSDFGEAHSRGEGLHT
jgi:hypothetical protein